jgi:hypothetical protein
MSAKWEQNRLPSREARATLAPFSKQAQFQLSASREAAMQRKAAYKLVPLLKNARLTASRAMVFIEDVRANPTPAEFNDRVGKATRDMTQQIGNVKKLTGIGFHFDRMSRNLKASQRRNMNCFKPKELLMILWRIFRPTRAPGLASYRN